MKGPFSAFTLTFLLILTKPGLSQQATDTVFLMNGHIVAGQVIDTLGGIVITNSKKENRVIEYDPEQLFLARFANGSNRYYYEQDSVTGNWLSREEMLMYMKGERDARKNFLPRGSIIGAGLTGVAAGLTGSFWSPIAPYTYMALSGITKVKIRQSTMSDPSCKTSEPYIMGYERVAREKRKLHSLISGTAGLVVGVGLFALLHSYYPESIKFGFTK